MTINQRRYTQTLAKRFDMQKTGIIPALTGAAPLSKAEVPRTDMDTEELRNVLFREAVGELIWINAIKRPDVAYAVHMSASSATAWDPRTGRCC